MRIALMIAAAALTLPTLASAQMTGGTGSASTTGSMGTGSMGTGTMSTGANGQSTAGTTGAMGTMHGKTGTRAGMHKGKTGMTTGTSTSTNGSTSMPGTSTDGSMSTGMSTSTTTRVRRPGRWVERWARAPPPQNDCTATVIDRRTETAGRSNERPAVLRLPGWTMSIAARRSDRPVRETQSENGSRTRMVSSRSGLVETSATGQLINSRPGGCI